MNYEIKRPLMKVIDKCLLDHAAAVGTKEGGPDIEDVYRLQNLSKIHYYLKEEHDFLADEVTALLQFTDPLTVALECWKEQDHPWEFPICDILYAIKAYERFPLVNPAGYVQQKVDQIQSLKDRLDRNMSDFRAELLGMDKMEIIAMSAEISAMQGAHNFMKKYFKFEPGNAEILLRMENPLKFVATQWRSDVAELFDMNAQVGEAIVEAGKEAAVLRYFAAPEQRQAISAEVQATLQMLVAIKVSKTGGRLTADLLKWAMRKYMAQSQNPKIHHGKQTVKQLVGQGTGVKSIDITAKNIKSFESVAKKYGVDFALKKNPEKGEYYVFFKARDDDAMKAAFAEYTAKTIRRKAPEKPSVRRQLAHFKEVARSMAQDTVKDRDRGERGL